MAIPWFQITGDILENDNHVDVQTGHLAGIADWRDAEVGPFGMQL